MPEVRFFTFTDRKCDMNQCTEKIKNKVAIHETSNFRSFPGFQVKLRSCKKFLNWKQAKITGHVI